MNVTCAHPRCRTSLDEFPVQCPHGLPFCEYCTWEEACMDCAQDPRDPWRAGIDDAARRATHEAPGRPLEPPCRCGWPDVSPMGVPPVRVPVLDLTDAPGVKAPETSEHRRTCKACTHPIPAGQPAIVQRLVNPGSVLNRYHPVCVEVR